MSIDLKLCNGYVYENQEEGVFLVNRKVFTDQEILEKERKLIFDKCWLYLGHESEVEAPGEYKTRKVGGRNLIFAKGSDGVIRAFLNTCTHRGALVCRELQGNSKTFQCFYHAWTFNNHGELVGTPGALDGYPPDFNKDGRLNLKQVPRLESYRGFIFINFDPNAFSLEDYLAGAKERLDKIADQGEYGMEIVGGTQKYSVRANWKLLSENSVDGYHGMPTHKTYFDYLADTNGPEYGKLKPALSKGVDFGNGHNGTLSEGAPWGRPVAKWIPAWGEKGKEEINQIKQRLVERFGEERAHYIAEVGGNMTSFPNLVINDIMAITIRSFYPISPSYMEVSQWTIAPKEENEELRERRLYNFLEFLGPGGFATPDDNEALELCQEGYENSKELEWNDISKGMLKGEPASNDELQMRAFWRQYNKLMYSEA